MASLKELRNQIGGVKSTRKITSAMKMVAAAKLRRAQEQSLSAQPYARQISLSMARILNSLDDETLKSPLLDDTGSDQRQLLIVVAADRGLCGGFNNKLLKFADQHIRQLRAEGKDVSIFCIGRKSYEHMRRHHGADVVGQIVDYARRKVTFETAFELKTKLMQMFDADSFDYCNVVYNSFESVGRQTPSFAQLIPYKIPPEVAEIQAQMAKEEEGEEGMSGIYSFEPDEASIMQDLVPHQLATQLYRMLLDTAAGEQAARMAAMDAATRNAKDMIERLTQQYNRERQAYITREIIEIVSCADALAEA